MLTFGGVVDGTGTSAFGNQEINTHAFVGGWTKVISSTMVNEARVSWSRSRSDAVHQAFGVTPPADATVPNSVTDPTVAGGLPGITIDGFFGGSGLGRIGSPDFLPKFQHTDQLRAAAGFLRRPMSFRQQLVQSLAQPGDGRGFSG